MLRISAPEAPRKLVQFGLDAQNTDTFLIEQHNLAPDAFLQVLEEQAADRRLACGELITILAKMAPRLPGSISA